MGGCPALLSSKTDDTATDKTKKVVIIGLENAGKTSILYYLKYQKSMPTVPTTSVNIENITLKSQEFFIFDIGGKVNSLWSHYYENVSAIIFVIDATDSSKFFSIREEFVKLNEYFKDLKTIFLIYLNKADSEKVIDENEIFEKTRLHEILNFDVIVQKCSAQSGYGILEGMHKLSMLLSKEPIPQKYKTKGNDSQNTPESFRLSALMK